MIRRLRIQFVTITVLSTSLLLLLLLGTLTAALSAITAREEQQMLHAIASVDGAVFSVRTLGTAGRMQDDDLMILTRTRPELPEPQEAIQTFSVRFDHNGDVLQILSPGSYATLSETEMKTLGAQALAQGNGNGRLHGYRYLVEEKAYGTIAVLLDSSTRHSLLALLFHLCLIVGLFGIVALFVVCLLLSRWVVRPVTTAFERQKRFISDASHELKTPLTVIAASADILEQQQSSPNKWLETIQSQTLRMKGLVIDLLQLAEVENAGQVMTFASFHLSRALLRAALPFESPAFERHIDYKLDVADNVLCTGNERALGQLAGLLLDNAFQHTPDGGAVRVELHTKGARVTLLVENTGSGVSADDLPHLFERFYRSDASRSRATGGVGLGLAIAKSIVDAHHGQITVESTPDEWTRFRVTLPTRTRSASE